MALRNAHHQKRTAWTIIVSALVLFFTIFTVAQVTPAFNVFFIKHIIKANDRPTDRNLDKMKEQVNVAKNIRYSNYERKQGLLDIYYPKDAKNAPVIVWIHGGGYISGSKEQRQEYGMILAKNGYVVVNMNYALAPLNKYPTPVTQTYEALKYMKAHIKNYGGDMDRLFIAGDSAGAQIASQTAAAITNPQLADSMELPKLIHQEQLKGVVLFCGLYHMDTVRETGFPFIRTYLWSYTGSKDFETYSRIDELSTIKQVTSEYPPAFITAGDQDKLEIQSKELSHVLKKKGVEVEDVFFDDPRPGLGHQYQFKLDQPYAQQTLKKTVDFLKSHS